MRSVQRIYCHACGRHVRFSLDLGLEGNHVLRCPTCAHEHCRVVKNGRVTNDRWASRNGPTYTITNATTITVIAQISTNSNAILWDSWSQTTAC